MARLPPQTEAIDEEPFDSVISLTTLIEYAKSSGFGNAANSDLFASLPCPISRLLGVPTLPHSPVAYGGIL